jgi:hypothetical protein
MKNITTTAAALIATAAGSAATLVAEKPTKAPKKGRKPSKRAKGTIATIEERANVLTEEGTGAVTPTHAAAGLAALEHVENNDVNLRDPTISKQDRSLTRDTAIEVCIQIGLGNKSGGFGPMVRSVISILLRDRLKKKVASRDDFTAENIEAVLTLEDFQSSAANVLADYVTGLKQDAAETTLKYRDRNHKLAIAWIETGMHASYLAALRVLKQLGNRVQFGKGESAVDLPLNDALAIAYGRNLTASVLLKRHKAGLAS